MTRTVCIGVLVILAAPLSAHAQAWTRDAGSVYVNLSHRFISADEFYTPDGSRRPLASTYRQHSLGLYAEVGAVDRWLTLSFEGELFRRNLLEDQGATTGLGDLRLGAWTGLVTTPIRLAFGVVVGLPTGDPEPMPGAGADSDARFIAASLPTGDGETDVALRLALGHAFGGGGWPLYHYALVDVGYWLRTEGVTDSIAYRIETGFRPAPPGWERLSLLIRLLGVEPLSEADGGASFAGLGEGVAYTAWGAELAVRIVDTLNLGAGYESALRAQSLPSGAALKFFVSWER